jgi:hypothetical protein
VGGGGVLVVERERDNLEQEGRRERGSSFVRESFGAPVHLYIYNPPPTPLHITYIPPPPGERREVLVLNRRA